MFVIRFKHKQISRGFLQIQYKKQYFRSFIHIKLAQFMSSSILNVKLCRNNITKIVKFIPIFQTQGSVQFLNFTPRITIFKPNQSDLTQNTMKTNHNSYLIPQEPQDHLLIHHEEILNLCDRQKNKVQNDLSFLSGTGKSSAKVRRTLTKNNHNQDLQELLQTQTIIYGNMSNLSTQKKRLFTDTSFFSKDHTHDHSNQEGYNQFMHKIHFQRSRNRQLNQQLAEQKQKMIQKYLHDLMEEFKQLSSQNKHLRQIFKKQAGGGFKVNPKKNLTMKLEQTSKGYEIPFHNQNQTPRNVKTGRRSIATDSVSGSEQIKYNTSKLNQPKQRSLFGIGKENFVQPKKLDMVRYSSKLIYCESSTNIQSGQSLVPSPKKHKRRQSQLTQRKDYPVKQNNQDDYLLIFDNNSEFQFDNQATGRMSQPGKMRKQKYAPQIYDKQSDRNSNHWAKAMNSEAFMGSMQRNSNYINHNNKKSQHFIEVENQKNIFIEFLQSLLLEQKIAYNQMADEMNDEIDRQQDDFNVPSYQNIKFIEQLECQIATKNLKLRQLQQVVNVFKAQIQEIIGTDIKMINQVMIELLEVKGKYLEMQEKVNGLLGLRRQLQSKEKLKEDILQSIRQKTERKNKQNKSSLQQGQKSDGSLQLFTIPHSIKQLFDVLNIETKANPKPADYLHQIKKLPNNKQLFQPFDSKKRIAVNQNIKQVIDCIREGRKKFSEIIKIYEGRIQKLQEKIKKYKTCQVSEKM